MFGSINYDGKSVPFSATRDGTFMETPCLCRVGKANGSRECAPDDKLRVPTIQNRDRISGGHGASAPLPTLQHLEANATNDRGLRQGS